MKTSYDYIVVGAGSAGCIVASRLAEDPSLRILLIEAGPSDRRVIVRMPAAMAYTLTDPQLIWPFATGPEPQLDGRTITHPRGRLLGGSASVNGMVYVRGNSRDFERWAAQGLPTWDYAGCLPYFKKLESFSGGDPRYRGTKGPVRVVKNAADHPLYQAFLNAGQQAGQTFNDDYNGADQEGVHVYQANIDNGIRASSAHAYLHAARHNANLVVMTGMTVLRVRCAEGRAIGVEVRRRDGGLQLIEATAEVILSAGAYKSPHILLLSGIGDADHLKDNGIRLTCHVPGVGQGLEDHPAVSVGYRAAPGTSPATGMTLMRKLAIGARWLFLRSGLGATNFWEVGSFFKSGEDVEYADIQHEFCPMLGDFAGGDITVTDGFQYCVNLMRPRSRGSVTLRSADPATPPAIVNNYLSHPDDRMDMIAAVRKTDEIVQQSAWDALRGEPLVPGGIRALGDADILRWLSRNVGTQYHPASTCRMGIDDLSVVDAAGRVHGVAGLRVIDAAVMPHVTSGNLNCPTMMIAEKLSDAVRNLAPPRLENMGG